MRTSTKRRSHNNSTYVSLSVVLNDIARSNIVFIHTAAAPAACALIVQSIHRIRCNRARACCQLLYCCHIPIIVGRISTSLEVRATDGRRILSERQTGRIMALRWPLRFLFFSFLLRLYGEQRFSHRFAECFVPIRNAGARTVYATVSTESMRRPLCRKSCIDNDETRR